MRFPGTTHLEVLLGFLSPQPWFYWDSDLQTISDIDEKSSLEVYGIISWLLSRYDTQIWKLLLCDLEMSARKIPVRECAGEWFWSSSMNGIIDLIGIFCCHDWLPEVFFASTILTLQNPFERATWALPNFVLDRSLARNAGSYANLQGFEGSD